MNLTLQQKLKSAAAKTVATAAVQAMPYLPRGTVAGIRKLIKDKISSGTRRPDEPEKIFKERRDYMNKLVDAYLSDRQLKKMSSNCRKKFIQNLISNAGIKGSFQRENFEKKYGFRPPFLIVLSPTMRCNLRCVGCYAGEYSQNDDLSFSETDRIIREAKEMGIYFYVISGGEPYINPWLLKLFKKHNDCYFLTYTNGTLLNKKMAEKLAKLGNVAPAISVEGWEKETDERRGSGMFKNILRAMDNLREAGVVFGISVTCTQKNADIIDKDEFVDFFIKKGASFGWYFQYIPIGLGPDKELMQTPEQRVHLRNSIIKWRKTKPIAIGDFWNDGTLVNGCMAGGQRYLHITCKGDVEPCVFVHFSVDNIRNKSLKQVLESPFFKAIRSHQPHSKNHYTPCMIIDNPHILRNLIAKYGAKPVHPGAENIVTTMAPYLKKYAEKMHKLTDDLYEKRYNVTIDKIGEKVKKQLLEAENSELYSKPIPALKWKGNDSKYKIKTTNGRKKKVVIA
ncbi:radical SAM protein [Candidatus Woesearchaeota archaeon]|nr:MAG: radical SAM protein [Candidatus Woesearchaeota archaeon]